MPVQSVSAIRPKGAKPNKCVYVETSIAGTTWDSVTGK